MSGPVDRRPAVDAPTDAITGSDRLAVTSINRSSNSIAAQPRLAGPGPKAFISYVHDDSSVVDLLQRDLEAAKISVWRDRDNLEPGAWWRAASRDQIENGMFFIACFSFNSERRQRSQMRDELLFAIDEIRRRPRDRAWFLPVLLTDVEVPALSISSSETLRDIQYVSLHRSWKDGIAKLVRVMRS